MWGGDLYASFVPSHVLANSSFNLFWPFPPFPPPPICRSPRFCCFLLFYFRLNSLFSPDPVSVEDWPTLPSTSSLIIRLTRLFPAHHGSHRQCSLLLLSPHGTEGNSPMVSPEMRSCLYSGYEANHPRRIGKSGTTRHMSVTSRMRPRIRRSVLSFWIKPAAASVLLSRSYIPNC